MRDLEPEFWKEPEFGVRDFSITRFGSTKRGNSKFRWDLLLGFVSQKFWLKIPSKHTLFQKSPSAGFLNSRWRGTLFHVSLFIPFLFFFFFFSSLLITQRFSLSHSLFSIFFFSSYQIWLNLFSVFRFLVRSFFLSLLFVFLSYAYPSISHSFSLKI